MAAEGERITVQLIDFKRDGWRDAAKTLRKIADNLDAGVHPECTVGALTLLGPKGQVTGFGFGPKCDDVQCLGAMRLGEQKLIDVLLDYGKGRCAAGGCGTPL